MLAQQVKQGGLHRRDGMDGGAQVKGLQPTPARIPVSELLLKLLQHPLMSANRLAYDQFAGIFQRLADFLAAGHFAHTRVARAVAQDQQVAGEKR